MTSLEMAKSRTEYYKGTPVEVMMYDTVEKLDEEEKFRICYAYWKDNCPEMSLDEYTEITKAEFDENYAEYYLDFTDFLNKLTYSFVNEIWGTPLSLV